MLVYAAALTQISQYTLDAKAGVVNGSRTAVQSVDPIRRTAATDAAGTLVTRYLYGEVAGQPHDVTVLAVDPDTFPRTAFWDRRFASDSLATLMAKLRAPTTDGAVAAIAVVEEGPDFAPTFQLGARHDPGPRRRRRARSPSPAGACRHPILLVDRSRLGPSTGTPGTLNELWSRTATPAQARRS